MSQDVGHAVQGATEESQLYGVLAEFEDVNSLMSAARKVRDAGYKNWDCYTPFPVHGLDKAMGVQSTRLPWVVLCGGLTGCLTGLLLVWWTNAISPDGVGYALRGYDFQISGKPKFSLPANIPPIFELTILFSAFGAFFGMLAMNLLPKFYNPVHKCKRFNRVTQDRFFIGVEADDDNFDLLETTKLLNDAGASAIEELEE